MSSSKSPPQVSLFIHGQKVASKSKNFRNIVNPATQEVIAVVPFATVEEVNDAVASAVEAFKTWKKTPIGVRSRIFLKYQPVSYTHLTLPTKRIV